MREVRYFYVPQASEATELPADEAVHALRVLRLKEGDEMYLMNGEGSFFRAEVTLAAGKHCGYRIVETQPQERDWHGHIRLALAPTKMMERMEWMVEKMTEVGFDEVTFLDCKFSERKTIRVDRVDKIVVAAMKQSRKAWKPVVNGMTAFDSFLQSHHEGSRFIAHCYDEYPKTNLFDELRALPPEANATVMVGPEGDFSVDEVAEALRQGWRSVSLGRSRLRTETAGLMAVTMARLAFGKERDDGRGATVYDH